MEIKDGTVIIRMGVGNTLLGFESVDSYMAIPLNNIADAILRLRSEGYIIHNQVDGWYVLTKGHLMVELRTMIFGMAIKGFN